MSAINNGSPKVGLVPSSMQTGVIPEKGPTIRANPVDIASFSGGNASGNEREGGIVGFFKGLFAPIWNMIFGSKEDAPAPTTKAETDDDYDGRAKADKRKATVDKTTSDDGKQTYLRSHKSKLTIEAEPINSVIDDDDTAQRVALFLGRGDANVKKLIPLLADEMNALVEDSSDVKDKDNFPYQAEYKNRHGERKLAYFDDPDAARDLTLYSRAIEIAKNVSGLKPGEKLPSTKSGYTVDTAVPTPITLAAAQLLTSGSTKDREKRADAAQKITDKLDDMFGEEKLGSGYLFKVLTENEFGVVSVVKELEDAIATSGVKVDPSKKLEPKQALEILFGDHGLELRHKIDVTALKPASTANAPDPSKTKADLESKKKLATENWDQLIKNEPWAKAEGKDAYIARMNTLINKVNTNPVKKGTSVSYYTPASIAQQTKDTANSLPLPVFAKLLYDLRESGSITKDGFSDGFATALEKLPSDEKDFIKSSDVGSLKMDQDDLKQIARLFKNA